MRRWRKPSASRHFLLPHALPFEFGDFFDEALQFLVIVYRLPDAGLPRLGDTELSRFTVVALNQIQIANENLPHVEQDARRMPRQRLPIAPLHPGCWRAARLLCVSMEGVRAVQNRTYESGAGQIACACSVHGLVEHRVFSAVPSVPLRRAHRVWQGVDS